MSDISLGPGYWQASDGKWYPPQAPPPPPGKKPSKRIYRRVWFWLILGLVAVIGGCTAVIAGTGKAINDANNKHHTIIYSVTGSASTADITYDSFDNANSGSSQLSNQALPWTKTFTGSGIFNAYSVSATLGDSGGSIACSVTVDGKRISAHTSSGAFASVDCLGNS